MGSCYSFEARLTGGLRVRQERKESMVGQVGAGNAETDVADMLSMALNRRGGECQERFEL